MPTRAVKENQRAPRGVPRPLARVVTWAAVLVVAALAIQPLLGLPPPTGHDVFSHYYRIPIVTEMWRNGIFFSRWAPDLVYGYGSPLFNFYPPLSAYLLTTLYWLVGENGPVAYSLSYAVSLLIAALSMFMLGRQLFGPAGGLLASAAYTWSPHMLLQTYSRGSLSNALALAFAPLAAYAVLRVAEHPAGRRIAFAALSVALILISHTASGLLFFGGLVLLGLAASRFVYRVRPGPVLFALLLGLALSAFSWLPGLAEIGATRYAESVEDGAQFADHFAAVLDWPEQTIAGLVKVPLRHNVGLTQLLLAVTALALVLVLGWQRRATPAGSLSLFAGLSGLVGMGIFIFATPASAWFWQNSATLRQLQFPWRLLDLALLLLALASAWWAAILRPNWRTWLLGTALALMYLNAVPYLYPARLDALPRQPTLADASRIQKEQGVVGLTAWGEYSSAAVEEWPAGPAFAGADRGAPLQEKVQLPDSAELRGADGSVLAATWDLSTREPATVTLAVHDFPGWKAEIDGDPVPTRPDEQGRIQIGVPAGRHTLAVRWARTPVRWLADALSFLALGTAGWLSLRPRRVQEAGVAPSNSAVPGPVLLVLIALLVLKVAVFDVTSTPLVAHADSRHVPGIPQPDHGDFGVFRLIGYEMAGPDVLALYWHADRQLAQDYIVRVTVADALGVPVKEIDNYFPGDKPTTSWEAGTLVRDVYELPLEDRPAPVVYDLSVSVLDPETKEPLPMLDGPPAATTVGVGTIKRGPEPVTIPVEAQALDALFGEAIALAHVQAPRSVRPGEPLKLTLYWASQAVVDVDYTVFVHLLRADGEFVAAFDAKPLGGLYPTSVWEPGELIADARELALDVPPGDYLLQSGLYELESGARLPVTGAATAGDGVITLASFAVRE